MLIYTVSQKMSQVWLAIGLSHIHQFFLQFLALVISRDLEIGCKYNILQYLAFTYFIMLWSEMMEMTRFPKSKIVKKIGGCVLKLYPVKLGALFWDKLYIWQDLKYKVRFL